VTGNYQLISLIQLIVDIRTILICGRVYTHFNLFCLLRCEQMTVLHCNEDGNLNSAGLDIFMFTLIRSKAERNGGRRWSRVDMIASAKLSLGLVTKMERPQLVKQQNGWFLWQFFQLLKCISHFSQIV
jgi:hypothetical protein